MTTKLRPKRPTRAKKSDRMLGPASAVEEQAMHMSIAPFDRVATEMDQKWGIDVLPELVSPEMAHKYGQALGKLNNAIDANDAATVVKYVGVCIRGMQAMDAEAVAAGKKPVSDECWTVEINGNRYGILKDERAWPWVKEQMPGVELFSGREIALAIETYKQTKLGEMMAIVNQKFPDADIVRMKVKNENLEDEVPF